jgi:Papain fold toxin 2
MLTPSEVDEKLREIAENYGIFQCQACADRMRSWLREHAFHGLYLQIVAHGSDFIVECIGGFDVEETRF